MSSFTDRLLQAARFAGIGESQAAIADALGLNRQTVNRWFTKDAVPKAEAQNDIALKFGVDPIWLERGDGTMLPNPSPDLPADLRELNKIYLRATPSIRTQIVKTARALAKAILVMGSLLPPLLAPSNAEAAIFHKNDFAPLFSQVIELYAHCVQWLRRCFAPVTGLT